EPAQKGIKRSFIDLNSERAEVLAQGIAIVLAPELAEDSDNEEPAAQLESEIIKKVNLRICCRYHVKHTMYHIVCRTWYRMSTNFFYSPSFARFILNVSPGSD